MTARHELDRGGVVEFRLLFRAVRIVGEVFFGVMQRLQREVGVRHIGRRLAAVADAAFLREVEFSVLVVIVLTADDKAARLQGLLAVGVPRSHGEGGERE